MLADLASARARRTAALQRIPRLRLPLLVVAMAVGLAACGTTSTSSGVAGSSTRLNVVAAENFWGSIAAQLGGSHVSVTNLISNPDADPHLHDSTPQEGRAVAQAQYVIINGAGYDPWAPHLVDANPASGRRVLTIADLARRHPGDNPHMWYNPPIVAQVVDRITNDLKSLDSADAGYFDQQASSFKSTALARYNGLRAAIKSKYGGVPAGATESIFVDLANDLQLNLITPPDYMKAISEVADPTAADKSTFDSQITNKQIKVLVFNKQNPTPDIRALVDKATSLGIPVVAITETLDPPTATFQDWQAGQLDSLQNALARATGH